MGKVEGGKEMLPEEIIELKLVGEEAAAEKAVAAVTGEEAERAAPW